MRYLCSLIFLVCSLSSEPYYIFSNAGFGYGGDKLLVNTSGKRIVGMGDGIELNFGVLVKTIPDYEEFTTKLSAGIIYNWTPDTDGTLYTMKFPLTLMQYYDFYSIRLGMGFSYHMFNKLSGNKNINDVEFDNALAINYSLSYMLEKEPNFSYGLMYTQINYQNKGTNNIINGDRIALYVETSF